MFYILRHGRTDWNEEHRLQGEVDIPLNETGRQMAYDAAEKYKDIDFDICYCHSIKSTSHPASLSGIRKIYLLFMSGYDIVYY